MSTANPTSRGNDRTNALTRRRLLEAGGALAAAAAAGMVAPRSAVGGEQPTGGNVTVENLGPGVFTFSGVSSVLVGETMYIGSRNLDPTRVVGFHVPTGRVTETFTLGNGNFVQGLAADGADVLYAGVTHAENRVNLYRCDLRTGEARGVAAVPGLFIRDLAVASDGVVYVVGRPRPRADGPPVWSYDPATDDLTMLAVPEPAAEQGRAVDVTDTTVYYGCDSLLSSRAGNGLFAVDRASGDVNRLRDGDISQHGVRVLGDVLTAGGVESVAGDHWFVVQGLVDGSWKEFEFESPAKAVARRGDALIVLIGAGELQEIDLNTWTVTHIGTPGFFAMGWPGLLDNLVVRGANAGLVSTFDIATGARVDHDLIEAGAAGDAQLGMSVGAGAGLVYVGGNNAVNVHDLSMESRIKLDVPGEVKDMIWVDGTMYMGVYNQGELWEHVPDDGAAAEPVAAFPVGHTRPQVVRWDDVNQLVVVGVQADATGEGSLCLFDPATRSLTAHINPLGNQAVFAAAAGHGLVYIGGGANHTRVAAWDAVEGREVWRMTLQLGGGVSSLVVLGRRLFGITRSSRLFVIDIARGPELVHEADVSPLTSQRAWLVLDRGLIYGVSARSLIRVDPVSFQPQVLVDDLDAEWFSGPRLAVDEDHGLYTLAGRDLVRVRDKSPR